MVQVLDRVFAILEAIADSESGLKAAEVAKAVDLPWATSCRLLDDLEGKGLLLRGADNRYRMGLKMWEFGSAAVRSLGLNDAARPAMEELSATTGEAVNLGVLAGDAIVYLDKIESRQAVRVYAPAEWRAPLHCVALGKVLLAYRPKREIERCLPRVLKKHTPRTIDNRYAILEELDRVRDLGYATNREEWHAEICGVACPIRDQDGEVFAGFGVSIPISRFTDQRIAYLVENLKKAAEKTTNALMDRGIDVDIGQGIDAA